jgi:hypothetical protein
MQVFPVMVDTMSILQRIPFWLPPVVALGGIWLYYVLAGMQEFAGRVVIMLFLLAVFISMAVITPVPLFIMKDKNKEQSFTIPLALSFLCALALLGCFILGGSAETRAGGPLPPFGYRFPLSGWVIDTLVSLTGPGNTIYYPPSYTPIIFTWLFIEIAVVSAIICYFLKDNGKKKPSPPPA